MSNYKPFEKDKMSIEEQIKIVKNMLLHAETQLLDYEAIAIETLLTAYEKEKERKAYIKGTNDAHELCNKKWKDKIKAKIEEYKKQIEKMKKDDIGRGFTLGKEWSDLKAKVEFGQSLLEKE